MTDLLDFKRLVYEPETTQLREKISELENRCNYLQREINNMRRVMQDAGTWNQFCADYAVKYPSTVDVEPSWYTSTLEGRKEAMQE